MRVHRLWRGAVLVVAGLVGGVVLAGSAFAAGLTITPVPAAPDGANGWYVTLPSFQLDFSTQNSYPPNGAGIATNERLVSFDCHLTDFPFQLAYLSGSLNVGEFNNTTGHVIDTMTVQSLPTSGFAFRPDCFTDFERETDSCFFGNCTPTGVVTVAPFESFTSVNVDLWDPSLVAVALTPPDGLNGWYRSDVSLKYFCSDKGSGLASACPDNDVLSSEGASVSSPERTVTDVAGRSTSVTTSVAIDKTPPGVTCGATPTFLLGSSGNTVSARVTDQTSLPLAATVNAPAPATTPGLQSVSVTGSDNAGNTATVACPYVVGYAFNGFASPVDNDLLNVAKAGQAVPLKFSVSGANGPVTNLTTYTLTSNGQGCDSSDPTDEIEVYAAGASGLQNLGGGNYQINWKTDKAFAGQCRQINLTLGSDNTVHSADFKFSK